MKPIVLVAALAMFGAACSSSSETAQTINVQPTATPAPSGSMTGPSIEVLSPIDGHVSSTGFLPVRILADEDLSVSVNGQLAEADVDGAYSVDLVLEDGANLLEVVASALDGSSISTDLVVFNVASASDSALDLYFPWDGYISSSEFVRIIGSALPGASVSLNGQIADMNSLGIFDQGLELSDGPNLVEVVVVGLDGSTTTQSIAVFVEKT